MPLKIVLDQNDCIGSATCEQVAPKWFKVSNSKASLQGGKTVGNGIQELAIPDNQQALAQKVSGDCPVNCIQVKKQ